MMTANTATGVKRITHSMRRRANHPVKCKISTTRARAQVMYKIIALDFPRS